jgi:hypothetical protein
MVALQLRRKRKLGLVAALLAVMALAACDTQPATEVSSDGALLNARGACTQGQTATWWYEVMRTDFVPLEWQRVGPKHSYSCASNTGEVAIQSERVKYLSPNNRYPFRLVSQLPDGTVLRFDSNGTNGGMDYDAFWTTDVIVEESSSEATTDVVATAAANTSCSTKHKTNRREGKSTLFRELLWVVELRSNWRRCNDGTIRWATANSDCWGEAIGYSCKVGNDGKLVNNYSTGGNPEHWVHTGRYQITGADPITGFVFLKRSWCATNQLSASGATRLHGRCDPQPW